MVLQLRVRQYLLYQCMVLLWYCSCGSGSIFYISVWYCYGIAVVGQAVSSISVCGTVMVLQLWVRQYLLYQCVVLLWYCSSGSDSIFYISVWYCYGIAVVGQTVSSISVCGTVMVLQLWVRQYLLYQCVVLLWYCSSGSDSIFYISVWYCYGIAVVGQAVSSISVVWYCYGIAVVGQAVSSISVVWYCYGIAVVGQTVSSISVCGTVMVLQ